MKRSEERRKIMREEGTKIMGEERKREIERNEVREGEKWGREIGVEAKEWYTEGDKEREKDKEGDN